MKATIVAAVLGILLSASAVRAQGTKLDGEETQRWKVGLTVTAPAGPVRGIRGTVPVPTDWPEQSVRIVDEHISKQVQRVTYRTLDNGVKQMLVLIPTLRAGESAVALVTFEVTKRTILLPSDPQQFVFPKKISRDLRRYLTSSPYIETRHKQIRSQARELAADQSGAWETVESIYDWVRDNIEYRNGSLKGALAALRDGNGDCEELTSLFIALCRVNKIPARTVWIPGHCYPEFYLEDATGEGHWFPCQAAGAREFGGMQEFKPILQKGDNFRVPEKREPQRYVAEFLIAKSASGKPKVQFTRELLPDVDR